MHFRTPAFLTGLAAVVEVTAIIFASRLVAVAHLAVVSLASRLVAFGTITFGSGPVAFARIGPRFIAFARIGPRFIAFATIAFAGGTLFFGFGRSKRDENEPGEAEHEDGIEPGFSFSGVCDHDDTLMQGGVIANTRRHPCNSGCR